MRHNKVDSSISVGGDFWKRHIHFFKGQVSRCLSCALQQYDYIRFQCRGWMCRAALLCFCLAAGGDHISPTTAFTQLCPHGSWTNVFSLFAFSFEFHFHCSSTQPDISIIWLFVDQTFIAFLSSINSSDCPTWHILHCSVSRFISAAQFSYSKCDWAMYKGVVEGDVTYSRVPCAAPWCVAVCCTGLSLARTRWSRWMSPSRKQVQPKMDIPLSCKRTHPWRDQSGPARIQRRSHITSPCSLPNRREKGRH